MDSNLTIHVLVARFLSAANAFMVGNHLYILLAATGLPFTSCVPRSFSVVVLGDAQCYVCDEDTAGGFTAQTEWIVNNVHRENIKLVTQVGDIVEDAKYQRPSRCGASAELRICGLRPVQQWMYADSSMTLLDRIETLPWSTNGGNHELNSEDEFKMDPRWPTASHFSEYLERFGPERHRERSWFGGSDEGVSGGRGVNTFQRFAANGREYLHLSLELDIPDPVIRWANSIIGSNDGVPTIITTHALLNDAREYPVKLTDKAYVPHEGRNSGQDIWDKLVKRNPQVFLIVSGHSCCERQVTKVNDAGLEVFLFQIDYSREPNGGNGWLALLRFDEQARQLRFQRFSPANPNPPPFNLPGLPEHVDLPDAPTGMDRWFPATSENDSIVKRPELLVTYAREHVE